MGSEGTLAVVTGAEVKVVPRPSAQGLVVLSFTSIAADGTTGSKRGILIDDRNKIRFLSLVRDNLT